MTNPIRVTPGQAKRLERNLRKAGGVPEFRPELTEKIRRLRAENAALRSMIAKLEQKITELREKTDARRWADRPKGKSHE